MYDIIPSLGLGHASKYLEPVLAAHPPFPPPDLANLGVSDRYSNSRQICSPRSDFDEGWVL